MSDTQTSPETSVTDRLANFFDSSEPEAAPTEQEMSAAPAEDALPALDTDEGEAIEAEGEAEEGQASAEEYEEFTTDEGASFRVPKDLKPYLERRADYSRKTAEVAVLREQAQDRIHYAEAREKLMGAVLQEAGQLQALQAQIAQYQGVDTTQLTLEQKWDLRERQTQLERQLATVTNSIQAKAQEINKHAQTHAQYQWESAQKGFVERFGKVSDAENAAMLKTVQETGFSESELRTRFADPRFLALVHKAAKWEALQAGKPIANAKAAKAPPVVKPGGTGNTQSMSRDKALRQRLKTSGNVRDAAALIAARMR